MIDYNSLTGHEKSALLNIAGSAYSTVQGIQQSFLLAKDVILRDVPGAFTECGVALGASAGAMGLALRMYGELPAQREFHLFDSFEGIPLAGINDHDQPGIGHYIADVNLPLEERLKSSGVSIGSMRDVQLNFENWGIQDLDWIYHQGWFQHTLPNFDPPPLAMLRLDGDLYESTQCCLYYLYEAVQDGGIILVDDYPLPGCRKAIDEFLESHKIKADLKVEVDTGAAYWVK